MLSVCYGCGTVLREGAPPISHGICHGCLSEVIVTYDLDSTDLFENDPDADLGGEG